MANGISLLTLKFTHDPFQHDVTQALFHKQKSENQSRIAITKIFSQQKWRINLLIVPHRLMVLIITNEYKINERAVRSSEWNRQLLKLFFSKTFFQ